MNVFARCRDDMLETLEALAAEGRIPRDLEFSRVAVEPPREAGHGDVTANAAMVLAKPAGMNPRELAELLARRLENLSTVTAAEVAGPGFINMRLDDSVWFGELSEILRRGEAYGDSSMGGGEKVNVEFVSANPTGPLHIGHGRGAVVGDALAALLEKAGYAVTREYWVNDAGAQVDALADAAYWRYLEALGDALSNDVIDGFLRDTGLEYRGDYLIPVGQALAREHGTNLADMASDDWLPIVRDTTIKAMMELIEADLDLLGVRFDVFKREREFVDSGGVDGALRVLEDHGLIYTGVLDPPKGKVPDDWEPRQQTLFRSTRYDDDVDRPVKKSDGSWTYFATDMAYHLDKFERGFHTMIDVWGADHGGYVKRMRAAVAALSDGQGDLDVKLCQMVNLLDAGKPVKMSKRAGTYVTLREVIEEVGKDVVRFIMLTRKNDAQLEFDLAKVTEQSRDNPVFYVQYAHARVHSVMRHAKEDFEPDALAAEALAGARLERLTDPDELGLIKTMADWPRLIESAAVAHEPHRIAYYLNDLARRFHALWNKGKDDADLRFLIPEDRELTMARLALLQGVAFVIASGLKVFGVTPVEEMR